MLPINTTDVSCTVQWVYPQQQEQLRSNDPMLLISAFA